MTGVGKRGVGSAKSKKTFKQGLRKTFQTRHIDQVWDDVHKKSDKGELFTEADGARLGPVGTTNRAELDEDLPAHGAFYCAPCSRYFVSGDALALHTRTKPHKRRVKALGGARPHGQADAERAAGKGAPDNGQAARLGAAAPMQP